MTPRLSQEARLRIEEAIRRRNSIDPQEFEAIAVALRQLRFEAEGSEPDVADVYAADDPWFLELQVAVLELELEDVKAKRYVQPDLRGFARGQDCQIRIPFFCSHDPATSVLCHVRRGAVAGVARKPSDYSAFIGCSRCHGVYDGQIHQRRYDRAALDVMALEAICRTHELYRKNWGWR